MTKTQLKQARWIAILMSLDKLGFLTTSQIQQLHDLGGRRNTNRILNDMSVYLQSFQLDEKVYYLSAKGRLEIGSTIVRKRTALIYHHLMRNDVFIKYRPEYWKHEFPIKWGDKVIIPDAIFKHDNKFVFLEVDNTQSMQANRKKIDLYKELKRTNIFQSKYGYFPLIMYVTVAEHKRKNLIATLDKLQNEVMLRESIIQDNSFTKIISNH